MKIKDCSHKGKLFIVKKINDRKYLVCCEKCDKDFIYKQKDLPKELKEQIII